MKLLTPVFTNKVPKLSEKRQQRRILIEAIGKFYNMN